MIVRRFLLWARDASATERAEGTRALARAYIEASLVDDDRREAETAFMLLASDASPLVRQALADVLAASETVPHALILTLAQDQSHIAAPVLAHSPVLDEADLVDAAAVGDLLAQRAIARRFELPLSVSAALAEVGCPEALAALVANNTARMTQPLLRRIAERAGEDNAVREALMARADTPADILRMLSDQVAARLGVFAQGCGWMSQERVVRLTRETGEKIAIDLASRCDNAALIGLVDGLRNAGRLTPALMLRALIFAEPALAEGAFSVLTGMPLDRVAAVIHDRRGSGLRALYRKAGLPDALYPAFAAACAALSETGFARSEADRSALSVTIIARVMQACQHLSGPEIGGLMALMRRLEAEALHHEAVAMAESLADDAALALLIDHAPELLIELQPEDLRQAA
jgi:uncharacterized protein (DUF2336 family)